jgi:hypothetical protein
MSSVRVRSSLPLLASSMAGLHSLVIDAQPSGDGTQPAASAPDAPGVLAAGEAMRRLLGELCEVIKTMTNAAAGPFDAAGVSRLISAFGRLGHYDWQAMRVLSQHAIAHAKVSTPLAALHCLICCCCCCCCCAMFLVCQHTMFTLCHTATRHTNALQSMSPGQLASTLCGCAKLRHFEDNLCTALATAAAESMPDATGPQAANIVWALAHMRADEASVYAAAAEHVRAAGGRAAICCEAHAPP